MFKSCYLFFSEVKTTHKSFPVTELPKHFSSKTEYEYEDTCYQQSKYIQAPGKQLVHYLKAGWHLQSQQAIHVAIMFLLHYSVLSYSI